MNSEYDNPLKKQVKAALNHQAESLDTQTLQKLRDAREKALNHRKHKETKTSAHSWFWGAGAGLVMAGILAFFLVSGIFQQQSLSPLDDLDVLTADAELDVILQSDFYQWLDETGLNEISSL